MNISYEQEERIIMEQKSGNRRKLANVTVKIVRKIEARCPVHEVSLDDFAVFSAQFTGSKWVWHRNIAGKNILITGYVEKRNSILRSGIYISYVMATEVFFTEVEDRRDFLVCDTLTGKVEYTSERDKANMPSVKVFPVNHLSDELVDKIAKEIEKKFKKGNVKAKAV